MNTSSSADVATQDDATPAPTSSRRNMLRLAGAAAIGATAVAVVGKASPAGAANGDPFTLGQSNSATSDTSLVGKLWTLVDSSTTGDLVTGFAGSIVGWDTSNSTSGLRAGVIGYSGPFFGGGNTPHGVLGVVRAAAATGSGVYGKSESDLVGTSAGLRARSDNGPAILMEPIAAGVPTTGTWARGALQPDTAGNLWYCTTSGTPGTWVNLVPQPIVFPTDGNFTAIVPSRVYDSRAAQPSSGALGTGGTRTLSVKDSRTLDTGAIVTADIVPAGAKAITANVTVVNTVSAGFLAVNPGGNTTVGAATVNWFASGQILNNGVNVTINPATREVTVIAGGNAGAQTDFVIDVTGYFV